MKAMKGMKVLEISLHALSCPVGLDLG